MEGVLILDKPQGISSHDAVREIRRLCGIKRVGHLGTLDPLATGVLPLVVGRTTRLAQFFLAHDRAYEAEIRFGYATDTYDARGERVTEPADVELSADQIEALLKDFRGRFSQTPPPVSAKIIGGVPAYKLARKKQPVRLEPVEIEVYRHVNMHGAFDDVLVTVWPWVASNMGGVGFAYPIELASEDTFKLEGHASSPHGNPFYGPSMSVSEVDDAGAPCMP